MPDLGTEALASFSADFPDVFLQHLDNVTMNVPGYKMKEQTIAYPIFVIVELYRCVCHS